MKKKTIKPNYIQGKTKKGINYKYVEDDDFIIIPIETSYINANENLNKIIDPVIKLIENDDYLIIAETPVAISQGRLVDEMKYEPGISAKFLAIIWSKYIWGYLLGPIFGIKDRTIKNLRRLPPESKRHKEVVLQLYGWKHALKPASEAGIDLSNAPGTFVSLLPENPEKVAKDIAKKIEEKTTKTAHVLIIDTDATYKRGKKYFTGLPIAINGINSNKGVFGYVLGQLSENVGSTPLGSSKNITVKEGIKMANIAENYQKTLSTNMETIHSVKNILGSNIDGTTVESLDSIVHTPAVIVREKNKYNL
ncbi:MAG: coenzyme F420-0:L-glutamate ligase [Methanobrevibacter arboriphilus]|jgi:F420-0:gamma-glutamyl ligase-like protein|uniref:Gamma-glutamyl ligase n=2 Tax=Methanobrevibacter arboriphilus TaxID=39441 RepID=A0ACA8R3L5_METAZ|nr:coenzyme F420-0:L-glutamate ligase [Methanobrevibacter arboriphilus]MBF4468857.1 coenzyme F420-0:L-glutamate ligase [Methanobrevibacter arboriphilus]BBL61892.1 gamma-glutamyl ligase [Methanobrevibacter arboriphilus]GLI11004.1 gamma-glutamyl ligase [Methanobrevibacter arboriphilus]